MSLHYEILIPAHQAEGSVSRAVASAVRQTIPPAAIRVYVDGLASADDRTETLARTAGATHVTVASENRGIGAARAALLSEARAPFVVFLDSDDALSSTAAERWRAGFSEHPDASVIACEWSGIDRLIEDPDVPARRSVWRPVPHESLWRRNPITSSAAMIRREHLLEIGGYNPEARRLVDYEVWLKLATVGRRLYVSDEPVVERAVHAGTITGDVNRAVRRELQLVATYPPARVSRRRRRLRATEGWMRGLSRHLDYGKAPGDYIPARQLADAGLDVPRVMDLARTRQFATSWTRWRSRRSRRRRPT